jgi:hypothetical protein
MDSECNGGFCLSEALSGLPGGQCSEDCSATSTCSDPGSICVDAGILICLKTCDPMTPGSCGAPPTLDCVDLQPSGGGCLALCSTNTDCTVAGNVCHSDGSCAVPENCTNGADDDGDGSADCTDPDCESDPACAIGPTGAACDADNQCTGGICFDETTNDLPGGMCSEDCSTTFTCSDSTATCYDLGGGSDFCLRDCDPNTPGSCGAPSTLECIANPGSTLGGICIPGCTSNADCTVSGHVCKTDATCGVPENCTNMVSDDVDGAVDCEDSECSMTATCASVCATPTTLTLNVAANGNTVGGTNGSLSSCQLSGGHERVFVVNPTSPATRTITHASATDQGFSVRATCNNPNSEFACQDAQGGGLNEVGMVDVTAGVPITIIVDAFQPGEEGPFTLTIN